MAMAMAAESALYTNESNRPGGEPKSLASALSASITGRTLSSGLRELRRPFANASLTITSIPDSLASSNAAPADCSMTFHVAWTQSKSLAPSGAVTVMASRSTSACSTPDSVSPIFTPLLALSSLSFDTTSLFRNTPDSAVAE